GIGRYGDGDCGERVDNPQAMRIRALRRSRHFIEGTALLDTIHAILPCCDKAPLSRARRRDWAWRGQRANPATNRVVETEESSFLSFVFLFGRSGPGDDNEARPTRRQRPEGRAALSSAGLDDAPGRTLSAGISRDEAE